MRPSPGYHVLPLGMVSELTPPDWNCAKAEGLASDTKSNAVIAEISNNVAFKSEKNCQNG